MLFLVNILWDHYVKYIDTLGYNHDNRAALCVRKILSWGLLNDNLLTNNNCKLTSYISALQFHNIFYTR